MLSANVRHQHLRIYQYSQLYSPDFAFLIARGQLPRELKDQRSRRQQVATGEKAWSSEVYKGIVIGKGKKYVRCE